VSTERPSRDCPLCPRLAAFRDGNRRRETGWHNAPVPSFGSAEARLLVVGLAPGLKGANRTGRPFTGDGAGNLLYPGLLATGFACGAYEARPDDSLVLEDCRVTNAVRCVPPQNRPTGSEVATCNRFLAAEIAAMPQLAAILALGSIAHGAVLGALGLKKSSAAFGHGARHRLPGGLLLVDSYHCSRLNTNTGRLTEAMFREVLEAIRAALGRCAATAG
jgi:uracil-DNA glycosylase family 4